MKKYIIVYHDDLDGRCSAFLTMKALDGFDFHLIPKNYESEIKLPENPWDYDGIIILDYVPSDTDFRTFRSLWCDGKIIWIDHHISGEDMWEKYNMLSGKRVDGTAACELTWNYFNPRKSMPVFVKFIGNCDTWNFSFYGDDSIHFCEYMNSMVKDSSPRSLIWKMMFAAPDIWHEYVEEGRIIRQAKINRLRSTIRKISYEDTIDGIKFLVCNYSEAETISDMCHMMMHEMGYEASMCWYLKDRGDKLIRMFSARSISGGDIDVSKIAKKRGGGGHKHAAGWKMENSKIDEM